ncbi:MAG: DoxX family protein [Microbacteriaceae bacterium]|nr:DoxX family protein [Microbacteriaceae bacterium]MCL2795115.1 DoxX family protein [Microbacteriaceae bacterium]
MNVALWIVTGLLALAFLAAGLLKTVQPKEKLAANMGWVDDFTPTGVKLIGIAEVLGAIGLVVPAATGIAPILTPIAAAALAVVMIGALIVHLRRGEGKQAPITIVLFVLTAAVAVLRFGPYHF